MAAEFAAPPTQFPPRDEMDTTMSQEPYQAPTVNGNDQPIDDVAAPQIDSAIDAPPDEPVGRSEAAIDAKAAATTLEEPISAGLPPVEDVTSGLQPISDFVPKDSSHLSHPTPPPDEPRTAGSADVGVDVEMANVEPESSLPVEIQSSLPVESEPSLPIEQETVIALSEPSLVRPREDDGEDEPAAKRSRMEDDSRPAFVESFSGMADAPIAAQAEAVTASIMETVDEPVVDASIVEGVPVIEDAPVVDAPILDEPVVDASEVDFPAVDAPIVEAPVADAAVAPAPVVEPAEPVSESIPEPASESAVLESEEQASSADVKVEATQSFTQPFDAPAASMESGSAVVTETPTDVMPIEPVSSADVKPVEPTPSADAPPATDSSTAGPEKPTYSTDPLTTVQKNSLLEKMKNLKKTKNSMAFLKPVDPVALNIPKYPEIVKNPMDLSTMEAKLKDGKYASVQEFADDFDLIIDNVRLFNGEAHAITQQGRAMEAYFRRMMQNVPTADMTAPPKPEIKRTPSVTREKPPQRQARVSAAAATAPAPAAPAAQSSQTTPTYALQADGTPQIRRQSSNRPARAIKPPQNREISYGKPKRKAHQLELRFCEHVLDEISSAKYGALNVPFLVPVDPVALNIPHYRQFIKHPMDLGTMSNKLRVGEYGTATEFKKDFELVVKNCLAFNPSGNPVRDMAVSLQREFETLWADKEKWERKNQPPSNRASSASADEDSDAEQEEDDDDEMDPAAEAEIEAMQRKLDMMRKKFSAKGKKKTKSVPKGGSGKKVGSMSAAPKSKAVPKPAPKKRTRLITYDEKQEISEAVPRMDEAQVTTLTRIITDNSAKHRNMGEEMELEIDDLPNDVQVMLLEYVRKQFGNPKKKAREPSPDDAAALDDDDFEPDRRGSGAAAGNKRKKHKPMGRQQQIDRIATVKKQLAAFNSTDGSESPTNSSFAAANPAADTSGDEESEESEEE